jgi:hypothetical protein
MKKCVVGIAILWTLAAVLYAQNDGLSFTGSGLGSGGAPRGIVSADFNGDGHLDFATANTASPPHDVSIWYGTGHGGWVNPQFFEFPGAGAFGIAAADFNHDGHPDLAVTLADVDKITILRWTPGGFVHQTDIVFQAPANPREIITGDFNRDGNMDIAYTLYERGSVEVALGQGDSQTWSGFVASNIGRGAHGLAAAEINGDGILDLVATNALTNTATMMFGHGDGQFATIAFPVGASPRNVVIADFNHDRAPDFAVVNTGGNSVTLYFQNVNRGPDGDFFIGRSDFGAGNSPRDIDAIDADGDGAMDLAIASYGSNETIVLRNPDGTGLFAGTIGRFVGSSRTGPRTLAIGDFNEDGRPDVLVGNQTNGAVILWSNTTAFAPRF